MGREMTSRTAIERQLEKIKSIADRKADELERRQYEKYNPLFKLAVRFLKKEHVLMYGGSALNDLMPEKLKFYPEQTMPDIDVFTKNAKGVAHRVVQAYKKKGYELASFREALHENTYKVFVDGLQVLDISDVPEHVYKKLSRGSVKGSLGLKIVNPDFLRMSLHLMLSHPNDAHRWTKVYQRLVYFYTVFPPKKCPSHTKDEFKDKKGAPTELVEKFMAWLKDKPYVMFGGQQIQHMLFKTDSLAFSWPKGTYADILASENVVQVAERVIKDLGDKELKVSSKFEGDMFVPEHVFVTYKNHKLFGIYHTDYCVSYVELHKVRLASFHTLCELYMNFLFSSYPQHSKEHLTCIINMLGAIQLKLIRKPSQKKLYQQFVLDCFGPQAGLITLRRQQIERIVNAK
jgi:hypothetical protein